MPIHPSSNAGVVETGKQDCEPPATPLVDDNFAQSAGYLDTANY
jgi:hypothetical protein